MEESELNQKQREEFVVLWANYVGTHSDQEWSRQQNMLINSMLKSARQLTRKEYLQLKAKA